MKQKILKRKKKKNKTNILLYDNNKIQQELAQWNQTKQTEGKEPKRRCKNIDIICTFQYPMKTLNWKSEDMSGKKRGKYI